jgi:hypothetical protein
MAAFKTDKIIIEIGYDKSSAHFTDEQMEQMVDQHVQKIMSEMNMPNGKLHFNVMALASLWVRSITRESKLKEQLPEAIRAKKAPLLAAEYHDRLVFSMQSGFESTCACCGDKTHQATCIEHDSRDFSKDLMICAPCYVAIHKEWETKRPDKISPI